MKQPILFLMFGYPGAGKSTTAKIIQKLNGAERLSTDAVRLELFPKPTYTQKEHDTVYATLDQRAKELLMAGKNAIYDGNLNRYVHRLEKYELAEKAGAKAVLLWIQTPKGIARNRAVLRGHKHLVPKSETFDTMFQRVSKVLEEPREDEPVYTIKGIDIDENEIAEILARL